ncbi:hypothetical protein FHR83_008106 [Actinoplanes campanulatus]|uniref:Uncharacterized protein n=1 Tax=Actinoplanes campanulatus TaxID=113559 RepID=A0A7W5AR87_9ACTN|nr:hypothetical protein [Actinoplanes campanulatus]MBB3100384.1 hypothetical protein [Actinoplanes campanulatus]
MGDGTELKLQRTALETLTFTLVEHTDACRRSCPLVPQPTVTPNGSPSIWSVLRRHDLNRPVEILLEILGHMTQLGWTAERVREFAQLRGQQIKSWAGVEMALREEGPGGVPQFDDPVVPCLQLDPLVALFDDGGFVTVGTYESDTACGLWLRRAATDQSSNWEDETDGIYRTRALPELPTGIIDDVSAFLDDGVLAEVVLQIQGRPLLLMAGELRESMQGSLVFTRRDESVLVFTDPSTATSVDWVPERRGLIRS